MDDRIVESARKKSTNGGKNKYLRLLRLFSPYSLQLVMSAFLLAAASVLSQFGPYLYKVAIDDYIMLPSRSGLWKLAVLYTLVVIFEGGFRGAQIYLTNKSGYLILGELRKKIYSHLLGQPVSYFDSVSGGDITGRLSADMQALTGVLTGGVIGGIGEIAVLIGIIVMMLKLDAALATRILTVLPFIAVITEIFRRRYKKNFSGLRHTTGVLLTRLMEIFDGWTTIRNLNMENPMIEVIENIDEKIKKIKLKTVKFDALFYPAIEFLNAVVIALVLKISAPGIVSGEMSFGVLVAFIAYIERFFHPVKELSSTFNNLQSAIASAERVFDILDRKSEFSADYKGEIPEVESVTESSPVKRVSELEFRNVGFSYNGGPEILKSVSFSLLPGESVALVGRTGEGKSSILHLLLRFYDDYSGMILIRGRDVRRIDRRKIRKHIGVVLQGELPAVGTVEQYLSMTETKRLKGRSAEFIDMIGGPNKQVSTLSRGEKQILSMIALSAGDPSVIVLDEATSALDRRTEAMVLDAARSIFKDKTFLVVAHRLSAIRRLDRILVLHKGIIAEEGTHESLLRKGGVYVKLFMLQGESGM